MSKKSFPEPVEALVLILTIFGAIITLILVYSVFLGTNLDAEALEKDSRYIFIFGGILFLIIPIIYARSKKYDLHTLFRLNPVPGRIFWLSITTGLSISVLSDELDRLLNMIIPIPEWILEQMRPLQVESGMDWFLIILGAVIIASVSEEILFRGFFQVALEKKGDVTRAVLLSAISWTIIHMNPYWAIQIFITGVFIGYLAWRTDSIIPPILVHMVNNFLAVLFLNAYTEESFGWYEWGEHVSPIVLIIAAALMTWSLREISYHYKRI